MKTNWFQRHLNWTWVLAYPAAWVLILIGVGLDSIFNTKVMSMVALISIVILFLTVSIWVIVMKGRSVLWILLVSIWSPLWLENKINKENQDGNAK
jgi:hypothetical protein